MLEWIRENKRWAQIILIALIFPFACTGVEGYRRMQGDVNTVAKVDGQRISRQEFDGAVREQLEQLKRTYGDAVDPKMLETPQQRQAILDQLVVKYVLSSQAQHEGLVITDDQLRARLASEPSLQKDGKFSPELYQRFVAAQQMTELQFEADFRDRLRVQELAMYPATSVLVSTAVANQVSDAVAQERTVAALRFAPADFLAKTQATDEAAKAYYDANQAMFETPEQADIEYVVLSADAIGASIKISDDDLKQYYAQNKARYSVPEERLASHILFAVPAGASDAVRQQARAKAESVLAQVRKTPGDFARLAKQYSDDPISKEHGGDLEYYARGVMVKSFDDALFALKQGEISDIVTTTDGFHIIKASAIRPAETRSLESVRGDIETEVRQQLAKKKVAESIDTFNNVVYEQLDSLKPAATQLGLQIKTAAALTRAGVKGDPVLSNAKFLAAVFADDATRDKHNTKAIEVAPNTLVSGRVTNYRARAVKPFDEVKPLVVEAVRAQEALRLAKEAGAAALTGWREGKGTGSFAAPEKLSRSTPSTVPADAMRAIFKANAAKLPAYVGVDLGPQGYAVYRIDAVGKGNVPDADAQRKALNASLERAIGEAELNATIDALRARTKVEVMQSNLGATP